MFEKCTNNKVFKIYGYKYIGKCGAQGFKHYRFVSGCDNAQKNGISSEIVNANALANKFKWFINLALVYWAQYSQIAQETTEVVLCKNLPTV